MEDFQNRIIRDSFGALFGVSFGASNFSQRTFFVDLLKKAFQNRIKGKVDVVARFTLFHRNHNY
jgi:hypothetical protein